MQTLRRTPPLSGMSGRFPDPRPRRSTARRPGAAAIGGYCRALVVRAAKKRAPWWGCVRPEMNLQG